jgi:putative ABC transport system permease protein
MPDLRYAIRSLRATPIVSIVAILSLALGIGANTAIFSIIDSMMLRTLPVRDPQRLVIVDLDNGSWTNPLWEQIRDRPALFDGAFAWAGTRFDLSRGGQTRYVNGVWASGAYFRVLGVQAILGRTFTEADDRRGGGPDGPVTVISHDFWQTRYGGAADVIGRSITLDRQAFTIVGVAPPGFYGTDVGSSFDVVVPIGCEPLLRGKESTLDRRSTWWLAVMARLKPGQTADGATRAVRGVQPQIREATLPADWPAQFLKSYLQEPFTVTPAAAGDSYLRQRYQRPLLTIMVVVALVLLIACANIANLLLARATARRQELGVRLALGASRWMLARLLLAESLFISAAGASLGLLFAQWASRLLVRQLSNPRNPLFLDLSLDWRVLGFTAVAGIATALLFGVIPALRASRVQPTQAMTSAGRGTAASGTVRIGSALVVVQVALSLILLVAGGLFLRTFTSLARVQLGFDRDPILVATVNTLQSNLQAQDRLRAYEQMREAAAAVPGASRAAMSVVTPVSNSTWQYAVDVEGAPALTDRQKGVHVNMVTPGWFATYGTRLIAGRDFAAGDTAAGPRVAVVNETFARRFTNGANPIGRQVRQAFNRPGKVNLPIQIVGVVADAVYRSLREPVPPTMYLPLAQLDETPPFVSLSVRSAGPSPSRLVREVAAAITRSNPTVGLTFRPLKEYVDVALIQERVIAMLAAFFGVLALLLAGLGLYGVTAYAVSRRRAEIGIRMALGAAPSAVVRNVLGRVALLVTAGIIVGSVASWWAVGFVKTLLYGLEPRDPWTFATAATVLALAAGLAALVPARRAARIDPAVVLRES